MARRIANEMPTEYTEEHGKRTGHFLTTNAHEWALIRIDKIGGQPGTRNAKLGTTGLMDHGLLGWARIRMGESDGSFAALRMTMRADSLLTSAATGATTEGKAERLKG
jgi:hypothetical protein